MSSTVWLLTRRTLIQFPRNPMVLGFSVAPVLMMFVVFGALFESVKHLPGFPTDNYFEYLAPAAILMTAVPGIANSAVGLATDFQSRYLHKLLTMPVSIGSIMAGRLLADGARLFLQGGLVSDSHRSATPLTDVTASDSIEKNQWEAGMLEHSTSQDEIRETVRERYAAAALQVQAGSASCCGPADSSCGCGPDPIGAEQNFKDFGSTLYSGDERDTLPDAAALASLGCGNPTAVAELATGETVLDLGSGGGIDVLLSARRVGPAGMVYGLDMTDEMLELARANQREAGVENVEWLKGTIESIPLPDDSVDVIISNCVINLSGDKASVFGEAARVIRPGGRFAVTDVVADPEMDETTRRDMAQWTGCIAGALTEEQFRAELAAAGFDAIEIQQTHRVHEHAASAIVRARRP